MFVSVSEPEVPKEKIKTATVKKGTDVKNALRIMCNDIFIFAW